MGADLTARALLASSSMHAASQGSLVHVLPTFLHFFNADCLILGTQFIHLDKLCKPDSYSQRAIPYAGCPYVESFTFHRQNLNRAAN